MVSLHRMHINSKQAEWSPSELALQRLKDPSWRRRSRRAWRNGSAFDSRSKGWVFDSPCPHIFLSLFLLPSISIVQAKRLIKEEHSTIHLCLILFSHACHTYSFAEPCISRATHEYKERTNYCASGTRRLIAKTLQMLFRPLHVFPSPPFQGIFSF